MYQSIHTLRGLAAVMIVLLHAHPPWGSWQLLSGVPLFFVISGFVIFTATHGRPFDWREYACRRFLRIYPLWWISMAWFCGVTLMAFLDIVPDPRHIIESVILFPTQGAGNRIEPILFVGWSLFYEVLFYTLFGVAMALGRWWIALFVTTGLGALGVIFPFENFYFLVFTADYFFAFALGMVIAWAAAHNFRAPPWIALIGIAGILFEIREPLGVITWCAMIVAGAVGAQARWPRSRAADFLGTASYAIYLFHASVTVVLITLFPELHWLVIAALGLAFGCVAHLIFERPLLRWMRMLRVERLA